MMRSNATLTRRRLHLFHNDLCLQQFEEKDENDFFFLFHLCPSQLRLTPANQNYHSEKAALFFQRAVRECASSSSASLIWEMENDQLLQALPAFCRQHSIQVVSWNALFSEYSRRRDTALRAALERDGITVLENLDYYTLTPLSTMTKGYRVFGAYKRYVLEQLKTHSTSSGKKVLSHKKKQLSSEALSLLQAFRASSRDRGSFLSRYIALSIGGDIRMYYAALPNKPLFQEQLIWRSFYFQFQYFFCPYLSSPAIYRALDPRYLSFRWKNNSEEAQALWLSQSGYPYLDAHTRMLRSTGYMTNEGRMNVMFVAIKLLCFDPYAPLPWAPQAAMSKYLVDAFGSSQMLNTLWSLGILDSGFLRFTGGKLYGRSFFTALSPPPDSLPLIREWIPELRHLTDTEICRWHMFSEDERKKKLEGRGGSNNNTTSSSSSSYPTTLLFKYRERWEAYKAMVVSSVLK